MDPVTPRHSPSFKPTHMNSKLTLTLLLVTLATATTQARTINWGSSVGDTLLDSSGSALSDLYTFELGSFGGFVPDQSNIELWSDNWKPFDQATAPLKFSSADGFFSSSADLLSGGTSSASPPLPSFTFSQGEQAFIWAFNTKTLAVGITEWALITNDSGDGLSTDDWTFPSPADHSATPLEWRLPVASHVIFGGLNGVEGPGVYTPPGTNFELQTHTISVVPEPSGALLIALAGLVVRLRSRTRNH